MARSTPLAVELGLSPSAAGGEARTVVVDSCSYNCQNVGDLAMLITAVSRLRRLQPSASIRVITNAPALTERHCGDVGTVPVRGRRLILQERLLGPMARLMPAAASALWTEVEDRLRMRRPAWFELSLRVKQRLSHRDAADAGSFLSAVKTADLVVVSGAGVMTDAFAENAFGILATLDLAQRCGVPTAMVGQGVGPIAGSRLRQRAAEVLRRVRLIAVRERLASVPLLVSLGVDPARILVTGDDAIEFVHATARPSADEQARPSEKIGVSLRVASYAQVNAAVLALLRGVLERSARQHRARVTAIPIAHHGGGMDIGTLRDLLTGVGSEDDGFQLDTPQEVIARVGECRIVVTGSYHAAVFALAQGIPAVGLTGSPYYVNKLRGLAEQFGGGCEVVGLDGPGLEARISAAIDRAWGSADRVRPALLDAAARQIRLGRAAFARIWELTATPALLT